MVRRLIDPGGRMAASGWLLLLAVLSLLLVTPVSADVPRTQFVSEKGYVVVEALDDDLLHLEIGTAGTAPSTSEPLVHSPMVLKTDYPGTGALVVEGNGVTAGSIGLLFDPANRCMTLIDTAREPDLLLTTLCPTASGAGLAGFSLQPAGFTHAYGLGQQFPLAGSVNGDWVGRVRTPGGPFGNAMTPMAGGNVGNTQMPIVYFLDIDANCYALFLDSPVRQTWNLQGSLWRVSAAAEVLRLYVLTGPDLLDLRRDYLELTGRPPVPPKKMFGLWVSEYGYDSWTELDERLSTLRSNGFPLDGFVLDLQWYGGIVSGSGETSMGSLEWDLEHFPDPTSKFAYLKQREGIGIVLIEQPYVGQKLPEFQDLEQRGYLVRECETCNATILTTNPWWGIGGMLDWSNSEGAAYWHDTKRRPLVEIGVVGHWTDLGEPELYDPGGWYHGIEEASGADHSHEIAHNLYNLLWSRSVFEGYARTSPLQRPFILSRSGTSGSQRYGVAMWSGDIGSNLSSLATQQNAQMHMSFSGIDYYGSDLGGFMRQALQGDLNETYTQWFADGAMLDVPVRPHTQNLCNCNETAPDRVGDVASNLANLRLRYELNPYLYSLAHRAYLFGDPLFPPLVFYYPGDPMVREMGGEKLIGRDLLVATVAEEGASEKQVYLPAGAWVDYYTREWTESAGQWLDGVPLYRDGQFRLPLYARSGAIVPLMYVDERTMNIDGQRTDGTQRDELILGVYASSEGSEFTLYEDDGESTAYQEGRMRQTVIRQKLTGNQARVDIAPATGNYEGAIQNRDNVVRLILDGLAASGVALNGSALPRCSGAASWTPSEPACWDNLGDNLVLARSGQCDVALAKGFVFDLVAHMGEQSGAQELTPGIATAAGERQLELRPWLSIAALLLLGVLIFWWADRREAHSEERSSAKHS